MYVYMYIYMYIFFCVDFRKIQLFDMAHKLIDWPLRGMQNVDNKIWQNE